MEVTTPYFRLLTGVLVLLVAQVDHRFFAHTAVSDPDFPHIVPDRLQFFDYESFTVNCEVDAFTEWRVMRKVNKTISTIFSTWNTSAPSYFIELAFEKDSGEYWCENKEGQRSNTVNIAVPAGSVILEIPAHPVMEGDDVILHCRNKKTQHITHIADFYKDGSQLETLYNKNLTIHNVSKSDEGLYKCSISGTGESPESWLTVVKQSDSDFFPKETHPPHSSDFLTLLWITVTALLVALLLLLAGLRLCRKHKVLGEDSATEPHQATYAVVNQQRKNKESQGENTVDTDVTYAAVEKQWKKKEPQTSGAGTKSSSSEDNVIYSLINI